MENNSMIHIENITKFFGSKKVLDGVNLTINKGETFLIIGRSGAGKTVLLKNIMGLLRPDSGKIFIDGNDLTQMNKKELEKVRLEFGLVFQSAALFDFLTIEENVGFYFYQHTSLKKPEIRKRVKDTLKLVGLEGIEDLYPYQLSGGMKKRVAIARGIIYNPKIIIYDEPTTGIDPIAVDKVVSLIDDLHRRLGITSLVVTHDLEVGLKLADRLAFLLGGRIIFQGDKSTLNTTTDARVIQFIKGSSAGPIKETEV
ncbi:MAG: ATP-binding cassette domain-containing protein [Candidatus Omnitrophica bacterium]|nr:ATP-binding cassette domain-containing protein [Candidatus Omnitrophota bacterium]